jgi:plastocyanin domain-containing protein
MADYRFALIAAPLLLGFANPAPELPETVTARPDPDGVQRVTIVGGSYWFKPDRVIVKNNTPVELLVSKDPGIVPHSFVINAPEAGISAEVALSTEPKVIRFVPTSAGSYPFYCDKQLLFFKSHEDKGMHGVLEVRDSLP